MRVYERKKGASRLSMTGPQEKKTIEERKLYLMGKNPSSNNNTNKLTYVITAKGIAFGNTDLHT